MSIIFLLIPLSVVIALGFFAAFIWAVRSGQYEDTCTPAMRLLMEETKPGRSTANNRATVKEAGASDSRRTQKAGLDPADISEPRALGNRTITLG